MDGVQYTVKVQTAPGASEPPHGGLLALVLKSLKLVPVMVAAVNVIVVVPTLVMLAVAEPSTPTLVGGTVTAVGEKLTPVPTPVKDTVCGLLASLSNTLSVPVG